MSLKVFISYAREDQEQALHYYGLFEKEGVTPWIDVKHVLPGQNWEAEIDRALGEANVVVLLLSPRSVSKRGFVQREANAAMDRLRYKQLTDIYIIPLLLELCEVPSQIASRLHYLDLNIDDAWSQVKAALRVASEQQAIQLERGVFHGQFILFAERLHETCVGQPGYEVDIEYPRFESISSPSIARELSNLFVGRANKNLIAERQSPWEQTPELYAGLAPELSMNRRWEGYGIVHATERVLSLTYEIGWYGAGAAHSNLYFETYNFACLDKLHSLAPVDFFTQPQAAFSRIIEICVQELSCEYWKRTGERPDEGQVELFRRGAEENLNNFCAFNVNGDRFTFLFAPYQVSAYAMGRWSVDVSFYDLLDLLKVDGPHTYAMINQPTAE